MNNSGKISRLLEREKVLLQQKGEYERSLRMVKEELEEVRDEIAAELPERINKNKRKRKIESIISDVDSTDENTYQNVDKKKQKKRQRKFKEILIRQPEIIEESRMNLLNEKDKMDQIENVTIEGIAERYKRAIKKKGEAMEASKEELKAWYRYAEWFRKKVLEKQIEFPEEKGQTIRKRIYNVLEKLLPEESREKIRKRTQNAEKVYELFKGNVEEMDKVRITGMSYFTKTKMKEILAMKENYKKNGEIRI